MPIGEGRELSFGTPEREKKYVVKDVTALREYLNNRQPSSMSLRGYRDCKHVVFRDGMLVDHGLDIEVSAPQNIGVMEGETLEGWAYRLTAEDSVHGKIMLKSAPDPEELSRGNRVSIEVPLELDSGRIVDFIEGCDIGYVIKWRYLVPLEDGVLLTVDEFQDSGGNRGYMVEVENPPTNLREILPSWVGSDVTNQDYTVFSFAKNGLPSEIVVDESE